ncbi:hypothetical protein [Parasitella parasitica]|uniref:tRNA-splicing endonuclease subunit Sen54 N-terminal domain-containing protein n=1 Tax=Parasitella parasitica TaxID=35722 RepID=A0A0B7MWX1_9FUNG|nr:hypothetical protein [Parasitella parasitica]
MDDTEQDEFLVDYSQLIKKKSSKKSQAPKRGEKANAANTANQEQLAASRQALFDSISHTVAPPNNTSKGRLDLSSPYYTTITKIKGAHLHSMGFSHQGAITLFPEEAAFLVARNALTVTRNHHDPVSFEDFCELLCECGDGWITFEKYQAYAYLKRLGYIVMRSKKLAVAMATQIPANQQPPPSIFKLFLDAITYWIKPKQQRPLVWDYRCTSYSQIYSTLQIIPSSPWYKPFYAPLCPAFDWDVYKPSAAWKKKDPGDPDFRVLVRNMSERMPTLYEQSQFFGQLTGIPNAKYKPQLKQTALGLDGPTFLMALVGDTESITFLRLTGDGLADVSNVKAQNRKKSKTWQQS